MDYTPLQQKMLTVIQGERDWMTVKQIAAALGRPGGKPFATDYTHLEIIADHGDIEREVRYRGAAAKYYVYRAVRR